MPDDAVRLLGGRALVAVTEGQSGADVWCTDDARPALYLKVGDGPIAAMVAAEAERVAWLGKRFAAPRVVAHGAHDDHAWLLTEALAGEPLGHWIKRDRSRAPTAARAMARLLLRLHALPAANCPFDFSAATWLPEVRRRVAEGRVDTDDFDPEHDGWSAEAVLGEVEAFAHHESGRVVVHGDYSLGNIFAAEDGTLTGCLDVGLLGVGDPYRDIFIGWRDLGGFGEPAQRAFLSELGIERLDDARRILHRALDELF